MSFFLNLMYPLSINKMILQQKFWVWSVESEEFDVIDHSVLLDELKSFDIDQTLIFWVRSFLTNRVQAVRIGSSLSSWKQVNDGVPQGTKLGLTLFAVMINKLLRNWHMRSKYVDDTTAFEIIPKILLVY